MTETKDPIVVQEALKVIDQGLMTMLQRELVSTNEVADLLLDVRTLLTVTGDADDAESAEVVPDD